MAKSVSVLFLLTVLAVAGSLHRVSAAFSWEVVGESLTKFNRWIEVEENQKLMKEVKEKLNEMNDRAQRGIDKLGDKDAQGTPLQYLPVTRIKVGGQTLPNGEGGLILIGAVPLPFLNQKAYKALEKQFPLSQPNSFGMLCDAGGMADKPVTLVCTLNGDEVEVKRSWHEQSDGSMCLGILPSLWT